MPFSGDNDVVDCVVYDASGSQFAVRDLSSVQVATQPGIIVLGVSGSTARYMKLGSDGSLFVTGSFADGTQNVTGTLTLADGTVPSRTIRVTTGNNLRSISGERQTFYVASASIAPANNKSMLTIQNLTSSFPIRIEEVRIVNQQNAVAVTGVATLFELRRFFSATALAGGTDISATNVEKADLSGSGMPFVTRTNATVTGESTKYFYRAIWSSDEWVTGAADADSADHAMQQLLPLWTARPGVKPILLYPGDGVTLKCATNTTVGTWDVFMTVTVDE